MSFIYRENNKGPRTVSWGKRWAKTGPNSVVSSFRTLGWSSSGPKAVQAFEKFNYSVLRNNNIIQERCRPILMQYLGVFIFIEHIRKLTIEFLCLFEVRVSNTISILPFQGWDTLGVILLTIDVPIEVSGVCLTSPTKLFTYKSCCFLTSALIFLLKVSNFDLSLLLLSFCLCMSFISPVNLLISGVIQGIEETDLLVFDGIWLSAESWMKEVNKSKFFLY